MRNIFAIALLVALSFSVNSFADEKTKSKKTKSADAPAATSTYEVPWGMAGCSIWNYVIKDKDQGPQIGVWALEHLVFGVQTFAISSGTSNCVAPKGGMAQENEQEVFVSINLADLQKEAAQGQGQHLKTLAEIFGCEDKAGFAQMSQDRFEAIFSNEQPSAVLQNYKNELKSNALSASCSRAG